jgi:acyl carrier protein
MLEQLDRADSPAALAEQKLRERDVIALVAALVRELHPQRIRFIDILPSSRIERDLGIDSLGRTELILRIERAWTTVRQPADHGLPSRRFASARWNHGSRMPQRTSATKHASNGQ